MGSFNTLITEAECPDCLKRSQVRIQFKFGNTWQLEYKLGDKISWGGNDIGSPDFGEVKVYGIAESTVCTFCNKNSIAEEYDIFIERNVIKSIAPLGNANDYLEGNGVYVIIKL